MLEPSLVKDVLIRNFKNFHDNEFGDMLDKESNPLFANNPFMLQGEEWKEKRAEITPAFTSNRLKALYPMIQEVEDRMVKYLDQESQKKKPFDIREICAKFTTDVVSLAIFGIDAQSFTKENPEIREMGRKLMSPSGLFILKMFVLSAFPFLKAFINAKFTTVDVEKFFANLMDQALHYRIDNKVQREDFLDYLIQIRDKKEKVGKKVDMAAHTISFFTDGFETSSVAIAHVLYEVRPQQKIMK